jgi:hypothetical protein
MKNFCYLLLLASFFSTCTSSPKTSPVDPIAEEYVRLVLDVDRYSNGFVDAYFGPDSLKPEDAVADSLPAGMFASKATQLLSEIDELRQKKLSEDEKYRIDWLEKQLTAVKTKVEFLAGEVLDFDQEAELLYDAHPPTFSAAHFDSLLARLDTLVPGTGPLSERYAAYSRQFVIPRERLDTVFNVAIAEARKRTNQHFQLPADENFTLAYVTDKPWSGYNYYQGKGQSKIQLNTDFPITIDRVINLAAHEGYPGHHVFMTLLDQNLYRKMGWVEFSVYPLFSPLSLISEGSANYGIEVAFPDEERVRYEREVLFPLAGLDSAQASRYYAIQGVRAKLNYADNEAARKYVNGTFSREEAAAWLEKYQLVPHDKALQRTRFYDTYRSYVINYNLGKDLVARRMNALSGTSGSPEKRWALFQELLSRPPVPGSITE